MTDSADPIADAPMTPQRLIGRARAAARREGRTGSDADVADVLARMVCEVMFENRELGAGYSPGFRQAKFREKAAGGNLAIGAGDDAGGGL